jgi:HlyD family secretion protein
MTASATILTAQKDDVLLVPNSALRFKPRTTEKKGGSAVMMGPPHRMGSSKTVRDEVQHGERERTLYVLRDGKPVEAKVVTGLTDGTRTEIVSGEIREGDKIIVDQRRSEDA